MIVFRAESPDNIQTNSQKELVNLNIKYISLLKPEIVLETLGERFKNEEALLTN